jgi:PilZ domain
MSVGNVIFMDDRTSDDDSRGLSVRDRRFCIRYPFAADVAVLDLETGSRTEGVTSDLSMGGIFVCTSKPLPSNTRVRITLTRKDQKMEALGMVRIVKPRIGMGVEFLDLEQPHYGVLVRWIEQLTKSR